MTKYASIVPLIGGQTLGMDEAFQSRPDYLLSYSAFEANDSQLVNYYKDVPYIKIDEGGKVPHSVDVVSSTCPCAGLSSLSPSSSSDNPANDWMVQASQYVIENVKPKVLWGENAPRLASKMGEPIVQQLRKIADENGYSFSIYKTKSILHGLSQVRDRSFYFFWKGSKVPVFEYYARPYEKIEDTIRSAATNAPDDMFNTHANTKTPSKEPFYQYVLEEMHGGISHAEFFQMIEKTTNPLHYMEENGVDYHDVAKWMDEKGYENHARKCRRMGDKLKAGGNIMRKTTEIGKDHIGAFVGHFPFELTHPDADRYINVREALTIMKMPKDFQLLGGKKNVNMICQNVPVTTARDMTHNIQKFLSGDCEMIETSFAIQDNKARKFWSEKKQSALSDLQ